MQLSSVYYSEESVKIYIFAHSGKSLAGFYRNQGPERPGIRIASSYDRSAIMYFFLPLSSRMNKMGVISNKFFILAD